MKRIEAVNDFVIKFANVNGSGSASANELFAKAILRMGVPVSPRNIFPSNIQGLPTWYEVRVSEQGYLGRRGGIDMMVAMNPQTWDADVRRARAAAATCSTTARGRCRQSKFRDDIHVIGMPLTEICNAVYADPRQRQLFKNIVYVGALSVLLEHRAEVIEKLFGEQYKGKEKLLAPTCRRCTWAATSRASTCSAPLGLRCSAPTRWASSIFVDGNSAAALGCVYGGATVAAWYPITPSSSVAEAFQKYCAKFRVDPDTGENTLRHRAGRGRDRLDRHGGRRRLERRARLHRHLGPGRVADDRVHRPGLLRRDPGDDHQRAARRAVHRHAHAHAAGRHPEPAPMPRTATPSTCCCSRRIRTNASSMPPRRSTWPTGCRRRCS